MLKVILQLKIRDPRPFLLPIIITLLITTLLISTSVTSANENQFLFHPEDIKDPGSLAVKLQDPRAAVSNAIAVQFSDETQQQLMEYDGISSPSSALQQALLADLNRLLQASSLYNAQTFTNIELSEQTQTLLLQNPQSGEALVRLNRLFLSDAYPYELASPSEKQNTGDSKDIETCRENLRQIKLALDNYRAKANVEPQWLSELSPQYLDEKMLRCPADLTAGDPGVLTEGGSDPTLPCSYLYEFRPEQKAGQEFLLEIEGDMLPMVRCEHHLLNLSVSGKLYRNGPQRNIYNKTAKIVKRFSIQPHLSADLPEEVRKQMEEQLHKNSNKAAKTTIFQIDPSDDLHAKLKEQFGEAFLESPEGKSLLNQLTPTSTKQEELTHLLGKSMPDVALMNLSGQSVKLETLRGKFTLVNIFPTDLTPHGPKLKHLEQLLENYDASQLQIVGISTSDATAIEAFKEKHRLSMPIWIDKSSQIQTHLNRDTAEPQTELITLFFNRELIVKDVFIGFDPQPFSQKVKKLLEFKE